MLRITRVDEGHWRAVPFAALEEDFLGICEAHRAQGRALAFAFLLFDVAHPYVRSALGQQYYWEALDDRSGRHISVFSLDVRPARELPLTEERDLHAIEGATPERLQQALSEHFDGLEAVTLPCVLFFQVADGEMIDSVAVTLKQDGLESTYAELAEVIGTAADAVSNVEDENAENAQEIFNLIVTALGHRRDKQGVVKLYRASKSATGVISVLKLIHMALGG